MEKELKQMYLDIVRKTVLGLTFRDPSFDPSKGQSIPFNQNARELGEDWPILAQTMIGNKRLLNTQELTKKIIENNIPGDFIETGVWRGGSCIFMTAILRAYGITDRSVYVCDSFEGLPPPKDHEYPVDRGDTHHQAGFLAVSLEQVQQNFEGYDLLTDQVKFVKGWFSDTLPALKLNKLSLLRLDGDMYESTIVALENLYPKLSVGGYVVVDDYGLPNCRRALADYREYHGIDDEFITIDNSSVYWTKTKELDADKIEHRFKNTEPAPAVVAPTFSMPNRGGSISSVF